MADQTQQSGARTVVHEQPEPPVSGTADELASNDDLILGELLVEDVSIDGMCGVY